MNFQTANAVVIDRPGRAAFREIPLAPVDDDTIVVRTRLSAISTGTEMKVWAGLSGSLGGELWYPLVPGYEEVGEIVHLGKNVKGWKLGERVMANEVRKYPEHCAAWGGQCALSIKNLKTAPAPFDSVARIPDSVSDSEAVTAYLAAVAKKGVDKAAPQEGETVVVVGMGLIGLSWVQLAKLRGARVIAVDVDARRLKLAEQFADGLIDSSRTSAPAELSRMTKGRRADLVVECSGQASVVSDLPDLLRDGGWTDGDDGGRIHLQADYPTPLVIAPYQKWFTKNLRLSMTCAIAPNGKREILDLIAAGKFDAKNLCQGEWTRTLAASEAQQGYEAIRDARGGIFKIFLNWN